VLSIFAALITMAVKFVGYAFTGSVSLFSDAAASVANRARGTGGFLGLNYRCTPR